MTEMLPTSPAALAACLDHTLLKPDATPAAVLELCREAAALGAFAACVNPVHVAAAAHALAGSATRVCAVVGFPLGASTPAIKAAEAAAAIADGAAEIDMVLAIGHLLAGDEQHVARDIAGVVAASAGRTVKVIVESALLDPPTLTRACQIAVAAGATYVKTSTGMGPGGATVAAVATMRAAVGPTIGVKASGGIRDWPSARALLAAGATRIGTSQAAALIEGLQAELRGGQPSAAAPAASAGVTR